MSLEPGLYIVATPLGNLQDISQRALAILRGVDLIAAEDTRHSGKLLQAYQISKPCVALHSHNESNKAAQLLEKIKEGQSIALVSDAGTPGISDPGGILVEQAHRQGLKVIPIPGPSAVISALSVSGIPAHKFIFAGFLPVKAGPRKENLMALKALPFTIVLFEAPHRILELLGAAMEVFGENHHGSVAREISKRYETIYYGSLQEITTQLIADPMQQQGEFVVIIAPTQRSTPEATTTLGEQEILQTLLDEGISVKQASQITAKLSKKSRNHCYELALQLTGK